MSVPSILFTVKPHKYYPENFNFNKTNYTEKQKEKIGSRMKESKFVRTGIVGYINRKKAIELTPSEEEKELQNLINNNIPINSMINYMDNRTGSTGTFDKNGDCSKEQALKKQDDLSKTKSCVWTSVISFIPEYSNEYVDNKEQASNTIRNTIDTFFKKANFNPDNMDWIAAYHINTNHRHIHLVFWEKEPPNRDSYGNPQFSEPLISKEALNSYKYTIMNYHNAADTGSLKTRDAVTSSLHSFLRNEEAFDFLSTLNDHLGIMSSWQYARQDLYKQMLIDDAIEKFIETDKGVYDKNGELVRKPIKDLKDEFENSVSVIQGHILSNYAEVNLEPSEKALRFKDMNLMDLKNRLSNSVLKAIKEFRQIDTYTEFDAIGKLKKISSKLQKTFVNKDLLKIEDAYIKICEKGFDEKKAIKEFNPLSFKKGLQLDHKILQSYGIDYVCERYTHTPIKDEDGKWLKDEDGKYLFQDQEAVNQNLKIGDYNKYTFITKNGETATYFLNLHNTRQKSFNATLSNLGMSQTQIFNLACDLSKNGLAFNLMTKTDNYLSYHFRSQKWETEKLNFYNNRINEIQKKIYDFEHRGNSNRRIQKRTQEYNQEHKRMGIIINNLIATFIEGVIYMDESLPSKKQELEDELDELINERENAKEK